MDDTTFKTTKIREENSKTKETKLGTLIFLNPILTALLVLFNINDALRPF